MNGMTRIIAFVLRAGGAVGGAFAGWQMPPEILTSLLASVGLGPEAGVTAGMAAIALCVLGGVFGLLLGSAVAGVLPEGSTDPVGTREEAAASVPRLRRHLGENNGMPKRAGSPLERLSAPPAGQQLPKHDLSHIPPAPKDDEISFDRIPNTGFYADIESPVQFEDDGEDLARFAAAQDEAPVRPAPDADHGWGDEDAGWDMPDAASEQPAEAPVEREAVESEAVGPEVFEEEPVAEIGEQPAGFEPEPAAFAHPEPVFEPAIEAAPEPAQWQRTEPVPQPSPEPAHARVQPLHRDTGHDGHSAPRFAPGLTGGMDADWFAGEADEEEDADDDGAGYGSLMAIGLGKTHQPRPNAPTHRLGEANLSPMPLLDASREHRPIPNGAGPQDFRLREALQELKRV
jgi:hypothetical protein